MQVWSQLSNFWSITDPYDNLSCCQTDLVGEQEIASLVQRIRVGVLLLFFSFLFLFFTVNSFWILMWVTECRTSIVWLIWSAHNMEKLTWIMSSALEDLIWRGYFPLLSPSICICTCIWIWIFNWLKKD